MKAVLAWLWTTAGLIFAVAVVGAITRLTESGLSITEWAPVAGALPPLNTDAWQKAYAAWQATPQAKLVLSGLSLDDFKQIFFWEWLHRLLGRVIGLVYALPLLYFFIRKQIPPGYGPRLVVILLLGGLQGLIGWLMVKSGLVDRPTVSHYRLALHLCVALLIYAAILWTIFDLRAGMRGKGAYLASFCLRRHGWFSLGFLCLTIIWGAFTAGLDAGQAYNTFPLMNGRLLPDEAWTIQPAWLNVFENTALVQFMHRMLAMVTGVLIIVWGVRLLKADIVPRRITTALIHITLLQIMLGIAAVLLAVPVWLGALHQANALLLLGTLLAALHAAMKRAH